MAPSLASLDLKEFFELENSAFATHITLTRVTRILLGYHSSNTAYLTSFSKDRLEDRKMKK